MGSKSFIYLIIFFSVLNKTEASDFTLEPEIRDYQISGYLGGHKTQQTQFKMRDTFLGIDLRLDPNQRIYFEIGDVSYRSRFIWLSNQPESDSVGFRQAFGEYQSKIIGFRVGLLSNVFGTDNLFHSKEKLNPLSLSKEFLIWPHQFEGAQVFWSQEAWSTDLQVFDIKDLQENENGLWWSGRFNFFRKKQIGASLQAQTGVIGPRTDMVTPASESGFLYDISKKSRVRLGAFILSQFDDRYSWIVESGEGALLQDNLSSFFSWRQIELTYWLLNQWGLQGRINQLKPQISIETFDRLYQDISLLYKNPVSSLQWSLTFRQKSTNNLVQNEFWVFYRFGSFL